MLASFPASPKLSPGISSSTFPLIVLELTRLLCPIEEPVCVCCSGEFVWAGFEATPAKEDPAVSSSTLYPLLNMLASKI